MNNLASLPGVFITKEQAKAAGLSRYFTASPCKRGHIALRWTTNSDCEVCRLDGRAQRYAADPEKGRKSAIEWYYENIERGRETRRTYGKAHSEENKARCSGWYYANKDRARKNKKRYVNLNRLATYAANAKWAAENLDKRRSYVRNRRARLRNAEGTHTGAEIQRIAHCQRFKCANCIASIRSSYHVDHINPISKGGTNYARNLQLLCAPCNLRKHAKDPIVWASENGRLL